MNSSGKIGDLKNAANKHRRNVYSGQLSRFGQRRRLHQILRGLGRDQRGVIVVMFALLLPIMIAFLGLGVEMAIWFQDRRGLQNASDAAAIAASYEVFEGRASSASTVAQREAEANGWSSSEGTITVNGSQVNSTFPSSGAFNTDTNAVEVLLTKQANPLFIGYFLDSVTFNAGGVATTQGSGDACILSLNATDDSAFKISGNIDLTMDCDIAVKSSSSKAFDLSGNSDIDVNGICVSGGTNNSGNNDFLDATPTDNCKASSDPLSGLAEPSEAAQVGDPCDVTDLDISGNSNTIDLDGGVYCNGIKISGNSNIINFTTDISSIYVLAGGNGLSVSGGSNTLNATGVTFYVTDNYDDGNYPDVSFSGNNTLNLSAPTSGDYAGVLFYNDSSTASSTSGAKFNVSGNNTFDEFDGTVYYPNHEISFSGNSSTTSNCGPKLLSDTLSISGNITVFGGGSGCASSNVSINTITVIGLVE